MKNRIGLVICGALLLFACSDDGGGGGSSSSVSDAVDSYNTAAEAAAKAECECRAEELGHASTQACVDARYEPESLSQCEQQAASCDKSSFIAIMDCRRDAAKDFKSCLSSCGATVDISHGDAGQSDSGTITSDDAGETGSNNGSGGQDDEALYQGCLAEYTDALTSCEDHRSDTLVTAFAECQSGQVPGCFFGDGNNSSSQDAGPDPVDAATPDDGGPDDGGVDPVDDTGPDPVDDTGPDPVDDTGPDPVEDTGPDPVEDTGPDAEEDTGSSGDPTDPRIDRATSDFNTAIDNDVDNFCGCYWSEGGYTSESECLTQNDGEQTWSSCARDAIACDVDSFVTFMDCHTDAVEDYTACTSSCPSDSVRQSCAQTYSSAANSCDSQLSTAVSDGWQACEDGQTPTCN